MLDSLIHETTATRTDFTLARGQPRATKPCTAANAPNGYPLSASELPDDATTVDEPNVAPATPWLLLWTL
jgi:hypothetical protein